MIGLELESEREFDRVHLRHWAQFPFWCAFCVGWRAEQTGLQPGTIKSCWESRHRKLVKQSTVKRGIFGLWLGRSGALAAILCLGWVGSAHAAQGLATYYTEESCKAEGTSGVLTADGSRYNESAMTCALPTRQFGKRYKIRAKKTGQTVLVEHTDFGPGKRAIARGVIVDLSPAAFDALGGKRGVTNGVAWGELEVEVDEI